MRKITRPGIKNTITKGIAFLVFGLFVLVGSTVFSPANRVSAKEVTKKESLITKTIKEIGVKKSASTYDKVRTVNDWLIFNLSYDHLWLDVDEGRTSGYSSKQIKEAKYHRPYEVDWVLTNKKAICSGYSAVFKALMDELGVACQVISSDEMDHSWNLVKMDDNHWYHVDVTWCDGGYSEGTEELGGYNTENFLRNDKGISADHYGWDTKKYPKADGKKYETGINHDIRYNRSKNDKYWKNGNIKTCYHYYDDGTKKELHYSKDAVLVKTITTFTDGQVKTSYYNKKGKMTETRTEFSGGQIQTSYYNSNGKLTETQTVFPDQTVLFSYYDKKEILDHEVAEFSDGQIQYYFYKNGDLVEQKTVFPDGRVAYGW